MKIVLLLICLSAAVLTSGCATLFVRSESTVDSKHVYPATVFDAQIFWECGIKGEPPMAMPDPAYRSKPLTRFAFGVGSVIDLPFSIVTDTIMLPVDLYYLGRLSWASDANGEAFEDGHTRPTL